MTLCRLIVPFLAVSPVLPGQTLVMAKDASPVTAKYVAFLQRETERRAGIRWKTAARAGAGVTVVAGTEEEIPALLPGGMLAAWRKEMAALRPSGSADGYSVVRVGEALVVSAKAARGELFGIGWLLREARFAPGRVELPRVGAFTTAPEKGVRGYQIGYRMKNNTYDAWTLGQFEQQMLDLAVFGMNTVQVVAPVSDDAPTSPLYPAPAEETVIGLSRLSQEYGLRFDLYYPEMGKDYGDPAQVEAELRKFEELVRRLPLVDSLHVPGGDPGHTAPEVLFPLVAREVEILHRYHPGAGIWVSGQGFTAERYERFYELLDGKPAWLTGVFFGPQSRESMEKQRARIPQRYPVEFYPDTAHVMHAQFPVPEWDPVFALTEGREPICPRPAAFEGIYRHFRELHSGFVVYSEGVNDDVNKALWGVWGWSSDTSAHATLVEYARYFFGGDEERIARGIEGLERDWVGPVLGNEGIAGTLGAFSGTPRLEGWRWDSLRYRAVYDRYVQLKRGRELGAEGRALAILREGSTAGVRRALSETAAGEEERRLREEMFALGKRLFDEVGLQLSVKLYGASNVERGANLDRVDTPLNDRVWIEKRLAEAEGGSAAERVGAVHRIASWADAPAGSFYDDLGDAAREPHLVRGVGWRDDPEMYRTAIDGIADETLEAGWRLSWLSYAETLYEEPLRLRYEGLEAGKRYRVKITYAGESYRLPMRLVANGTVEIQPMRVRQGNPETVEYALPVGTTASGGLELEWSRPAGAGGGGRGGQVAEVWLLQE